MPSTPDPDNPFPGDEDYAAILAAWPHMPLGVRRAFAEACEGLASGELDLDSARTLIEAAGLLSRDDR